MFCWIVGSALLRWVLTVTAEGSTSIYGPLAAPIAVLLWLYILSIAVLIGAALNAAFDQLWPENETAKARIELAPAAAADGVLPRRRRAGGGAGEVPRHRRGDPRCCRGAQRPQRRGGTRVTSRPRDPLRRAGRAGVHPAAFARRPPCRDLVPRARVGRGWSRRTSARGRGGRPRQLRWPGGRPRPGVDGSPATALGASRRQRLGPGAAGDRMALRAARRAAVIVEGDRLLAGRSTAGRGAAPPRCGSRCARRRPSADRRTTTR